MTRSDVFRWIRFSCVYSICATMYFIFSHRLAQHDTQYIGRNTNTTATKSYGQPIHGRMLYEYRNQNIEFYSVVYTTIPYGDRARANESNACQVENCCRCMRTKVGTHSHRSMLRPYTDVPMPIGVCVCACVL